MPIWEHIAILAEWNYRFAVNNRPASTASGSAESWLHVDYSEIQSLGHGFCTSIWLDMVLIWKIRTNKIATSISRDFEDGADNAKSKSLIYTRMHQSHLVSHLHSADGSAG